MKQLGLALGFALLLCGLMPLIAPATVAADGEEAKRMQSKYIHLIHEKKYAEAFTLILTRRQARDGWAIGYFGEWFEDDAPKEMRDLSEEWLDRESRAGNAEAQFMTGLKYIRGDYLSGDYVKPGKSGDHMARGVRLLEDAADQGSADARFILSQMSREALKSLGISSKYAGKE